MSTEVIFAIVAVALAVLLLLIWKTGRAIFLESVLHPLRKADIVFQDGKAVVMDLTPKVAGWDSTETVHKEPHRRAAG